MFRPFVSVIIPVYNVKNYFPRCIQSVVAQTYSNYEVVLIDDGSTDGSGDLCDQYAEEYAFVHTIHQSNQGQSSARNHGIEVAQGEYVCFIDSDDYVSIDYIAKMVAVLDLYQANMSVIKMSRISGKREVPVDYKDTEGVCQLMDTKIALEEMMYGKLFGASPCAKLYKKELAEKYLYPVGVYFEDLGTTYKIIGECERIVFIDSTGYFYVRRDGSTLHSRWNDKYMYGIKAAEEQFSYIENYFPTAVNAAKCKYVLLLMDYMNLLRGHSKEEKKLFEQFRKKTVKLAFGGVLTDRNVSRNTKIKIGIVSMGYLPMCMGWKIIDYVRNR